MNFDNFNVSFRTVISFTVISSLLTLIFSNGRFSKAIKYICGLCLLFTVVISLRPVFSLLNPSVKETVSENDFHQNSIFSKEAGRYISVYIREAVSGRFSINKDDITVNVTLETDGDLAFIKEITVLLPENDNSLFSDISVYVSDLAMAPCTVMAY